jgi:subtilisin family serine protease
MRNPLLAAFEARTGLFQTRIYPGLSVAVQLLAGIAAGAQASVGTSVVDTAPAYREDRILVKPKPGVSLESLAGFHSARRSDVLQTFQGIGRLQVLTVPKGETVEGLVTKYQQSGLVEFAEPDFLIHANLTPDDPKYADGTLWGLNNYGQNGGTVGADIDAPEGWDVLNTASNIVVAVLDTGVRSTHEDLSANMWVNPLDGSHGWNAVATNNVPEDDNGHGTLMAGVLGAVGNNSKGVVGVAWQVQVMSCKCLTTSGTGAVSDLITCIDFARTNGVKVVNGSLDSPDFSAALSNAIVSLRDAGIIYVASAGNNSADIDASPRYPSGYQIDNIVSVAYTDRNDALGFISNFGATNVDLAAPGDKIFSTYSSSDTSYYPMFDFINIAGTSYAAAYVSGAFALMCARYPLENYQQIISRVLNATDSLPSLSGKCVTGGRLNLRKALSPPISLIVIATPANQPFQMRVCAGPTRLCVIEAATNLTSWSPIFTNTTSSSGTFDFTNNIPAHSAKQFFRATSTL